MREGTWRWGRAAWGRATALGLMVLLVAAGCRKPPPPGKEVHVRPAVRLVNPQKRYIVRTTGQPGFIEAYEQTSIYPKVAGYIDEWKVDIGDRVKKGQLLAHLYVPDLQADYQEKKAQAALDQVQIKVSEQLANVAAQTFRAAGAEVQEARATVGKYQAEVTRWESEVKRLTRLSSERVVDPQVLTETQKQLKSSIASRDASNATVTATQAKEAARKADLEKAKVDIQAARARARVSAAAEQRLAAMVGYTRLLAPYDGVVVDRNADTGAYVQPAGLERQGPLTTQQGGGSGATPVYVVARTDTVRIFLDVPEMDANGVRVGSKATIRIPALDDDEVTAAVTRTSWSLHARTRTLRVEVDLPNAGGRILPNMYAYGEVQVERPNVWAVPLGTVTMIGNQNCCYLYEDGKAVQTPVQTGINDGKWLEVTRKRAKGKWVRFTGAEQVVEGDLSEITDGDEVRLEKDPNGKR